MLSGLISSSSKVERSCHVRRCRRSSHSLAATSQSGDRKPRRRRHQRDLEVSERPSAHRITAAGLGRTLCLGLSAAQNRRVPSRWDDRSPLRLEDDEAGPSGNSQGAPGLNARTITEVNGWVAKRRRAQR